MSGFPRGYVECRRCGRTLGKDFAGVEDEEPVRQRIRELRQLRDYAVHGVDDRAVGPCLSVVDGEGKRRDWYAHDFAPDTDPAPREWEWGV